MYELALSLALARIRHIAQLHGYAIAVHGSMKRDLDLIAVPWVADVSSARELVDDIEERMGATATRRDVPKPHGRVGYILHGICWREGGEWQTVDLSVMPRIHGYTTQQQDRTKDAPTGITSIP